MSTRCSVFRQLDDGTAYYGVYRHCDGYPDGAGQDLYDAIQNGELGEHLLELATKSDHMYEDYSFNDIMEMWANSDQEYGYIVHSDGRADVYAIHFGYMLHNNRIEYLGELEEVLNG